MHLSIGKRQIPWALAGTRAALGPVMIAGAASRWNGLALAAMVIIALVSDIYDGILARRWQCDTAAVRLFDSLADTVFYLCTALALWIVEPALWHRFALLLGTLIALELLRLVYDFHKFGKPASYHSWLAKTWGLVLAAAVVLAFAKGWSYPLVPLALCLGIVCDIEGLAMSVLLPMWCKDVKTLRAALHLRRKFQSESTSEAIADRSTVSSNRRSLLRRILIFSLTYAMALPLFAVEAGQAAYISGTSLSIAKGTLGALDTRSPDLFIFHSAGDAPARDLVISYRSIKEFQYSTEVARHLGVLPAVSVALIRRRERKHFLSITYVDASSTPQVAVFEVPKHDPRGLLAILRTRAPQACGKVTTCCGGIVP